MSLDGVHGFLDVESAALRAPQVGVANTNPQHILSVGSNLYVSGDSSDVLTVDGNVVCEGVKVGLIEIIPSYDLAAVANVGNVTSNTIQFTNPDTGIVATGNVTVGSTLTVSGFRITAQAEANDDLEAITLAGADTTQAIHITNATDSEDPYSGALKIGTDTGNNGGLGVAGNVHVGRGVYVGSTLDVTGDAIIRGDLSVLGTTTTIDTDNLRVKDPIIELGKGNAGTGGDLGLVMTRPSGSSNVAVIFDEDTDTLKIGYTEGSASDTNITMDSTPLSVNVNGDLSVSSNVEVGTANLFVDTVTGRVGIGKTDPGAALDVVGDVEISSNLAVDTNTLFVDSVGNKVGVGTNNPNTLLELSSATGSATITPTELRLSTTTNAGDWDTTNPWGKISFYSHDTSNGGPQVRGAIGMSAAESFGGYGRLGLFTETSGTLSEHVSIKSDGNVGIGVTNPDGPLHISKSAPYNGDTGPGIIFTRYSNTYGGCIWNESNNDIDGLYFNAFNNTTASTAYGATPKMVINSNGNVGIGTDSPSSKLTVNEIPTHRNTYDHSLAPMTITNRIPTSTSTLNDPQDVLNLAREGTNGEAYGARATFKLSRYENSSLDSRTRLDLNLAHNSYDEPHIMTFRSDGNVGIGTTDPGHKLHLLTYTANDGIRVVGGAKFALLTSNLSSTAYNGIVGEGDSGIIFSTDNDPYNDSTTKGFVIGPWTTTGALGLKIIENGNVGIGTNSPVATLDVAGSDVSGKSLQLRSGDSSTGTDSSQIIFSYANNPYNFGGYAHSIGTRHNSGADVGNAIDFWLWNTTDTTDASTLGNKRVMTMEGNGRVGIGDSEPSYTLDVNGSLYYSSGGLNGSDDRIKYNEQNVSNALTLISQLKPQKYEKIMERPNPYEGTWIPTDEEWENVKGDYKHGDEFGFIAQDIKKIPELSFLVHGEETRTDTKTSAPEEYSNLTTEEQVTYTTSYVYESNTITQVEYSNLTPEEQGLYSTHYTKQIETQTPLALNYQGLFVVAIGAIQELKAKNDALEARITALESA